MTTTTSPSALQMIEAFRNTPAMDLNHLSRGEAEQLNRRCLALEAENDELRMDVEELLEEKKDWEEVEEKVYRECTKADEDFKQKKKEWQKTREELERTRKSYEHERTRRKELEDEMRLLETNDYEVTKTSQRNAQLEKIFKRFHSKRKCWRA